MNIPFFNKKDTGERQKRQANPNSRIMIQGLCLIYVIYLIASMVREYINGESTVSAPVFFLSTGGLSIAVIILGIIVWKSWKELKSKEAEAKASEENAESITEDAAAEDADEAIPSLDAPDEVPDSEDLPSEPADAGNEEAASED